MDDHDKHVKFFVGSLIEIQRLQLDLDDQNIPSLVKNNFQSGLRSGFYGGSPSQVELFIFERVFLLTSDAKPLITEARRTSGEKEQGMIQSTESSSSRVKFGNPSRIPLLSATKMHPGERRC